MLAHGCYQAGITQSLSGLHSCQPTAHRFAFSDSASLRVGQTRADSASLRLVPVMKSSHRGAPASPLTPSGVESSVSHGRRPLRESLDIRALPPSRRPRPSRERQTGVTGRFPVRRAEPTFLADEMSAPADFQVNDAVTEERTSGRSNAANRQRIASFFPTAHRFVFVASDRHASLRLVAEAIAVRDTRALVRSRSSVACVRAGDYAGNLTNWRENTRSLPDHRPPVLLARDAPDRQCRPEPPRAGVEGVGSGRHSRG